MSVIIFFRGLAALGGQDLYIFEESKITFT